MRKQMHNGFFRRTAHFQTSLVLHTKVITVGLLVLALLPLANCSNNPRPELAGDKPQHVAMEKAGIRNAQLSEAQWIAGMIEGAYLFNPNLNVFTIDVHVIDNTVVISGMVEHEAERELAEKIALSVAGVQRVENRINLQIDKDFKQQPQENTPAVQDLQSQSSDVVVTARVKRT